FKRRIHEDDDVAEPGDDIVFRTYSRLAAERFDYARLEYVGERLVHHGSAEAVADDVEPRPKPPAGVLPLHKLVEVSQNLDDLASPDAFRSALTCQEGEVLEDGKGDGPTPPARINSDDARRFLMARRLPCRRGNVRCDLREKRPEAGHVGVADTGVVLPSVREEDESDAFI